jgi:hypothetical protein
MTRPRKARAFAGSCIALAVMAPPLGRWLEAHMWTHMVLQMPALLLAGGLMSAALPRTPRAERWNLGGVPALFAASLVLAFWMIPIALDRAVADITWDAAKALSLLLTGALVVASWSIAPTVIQAFFVGNVAWMSIVVGMLYQEDGQRLCNAYLQDDQADTGRALVWVAAVCGALWAGRQAVSLAEDADLLKKGQVVLQVPVLGNAPVGNAVDVRRNEVDRSTVTLPYAGATTEGAGEMSREA